MRAETPDFPAQALVLMEASTGQVLYEKSAHVQRPCASITKVMTLLLVFEAIDAGTLHLDDVLTASAHAAGMGGSDIWHKEGEQMTVDLSLIHIYLFLRVLYDGAANVGAVCCAGDGSRKAGDFLFTAPQGLSLIHI